MQRSGEPHLDHVGFLQVGEGRVQALEAVQVVKHGFDQLVDHFRIGFGAGGEHRLATDGRGRLVAALVEATRDLGLGVVALLGQQLVDVSSGDRYQYRIRGGGGFLDGAVRVTDEVAHGVDVVVTQCGSLLGGFQLGDQTEVALLPALDRHDLFHGVTLAGARVADVDALAFQIVEAGDLGVLAGQDGEHFALQGEDGTDVVHGTFGLERGQPLHRLVLVVGLHDAEVEFAAANTVDVGDTAAAGRGVALDLMLGGTTIEEAADRLTCHIIDAGLTAGADGHEALLRLYRTTKWYADQSSRQCARQG